MNSHDDVNSSDCMNSHKDMNSSEYMNSHDDDSDMISSDYENSYVPSCVFVPDEELDGLTNSHGKLNILDDTQECLISSHHKIAFDYGEDTPLTIIAIKLRLKHLNIINIIIEGL
jgi:hypothetical protein